MRSDTVAVIFVVTLVLAACAGICCMVPSSAVVEQRANDRREAYQRELDRVKQTGYNACKHGVPANANTQRPGTRAAEAWLEGWMEANKP